MKKKKVVFYQLKDYEPVAYCRLWWRDNTVTYDVTGMELGLLIKFTGDPSENTPTTAAEKHADDQVILSRCKGSHWPPVNER